MYTDHHSNTLSAATILSPLAMLGENKTAHGFKILCYANL